MLGALEFGVQMVILSRWNVEVCDTICWIEEVEDSFESEVAIRKSELV